MTDAKPMPLKMNPAPLKLSAEMRLVELAIVLPMPAAPVAAYVPAVEANGMLYVSGQVSFQNGELMIGRLGEDRDLAYGVQAARACGLMILAQIRAALGSLDRVERVVKLNIFVNSDPRFTDQPKVGNGASELMVEIFGEVGKHARAAVGVPTLPMGVAVEVDAIVAVKSA